MFICVALVVYNSHVLLLINCLEIIGNIHIYVLANIDVRI